MVQGSPLQIQALTREMAGPSFYHSEQLQEYGSVNIEKTVASFSSSCNCGKRPSPLLCGVYHDQKLLSRDV